MKKFFLVVSIFSLLLSAVSATEQDTVDRSSVIIREFRHMPERGLPPRILRRAHGLAIISVVKAGFIFSGKAGEGVVVARTNRGWSEEMSRSALMRAWRRGRSGALLKRT